MRKYLVKHKVSTAYHPQTNGQADVSNREIKSILEKTMKPTGKDWSFSFDDTFWAYKTVYKSPIDMSPYILEAMFPVELEHKAYWVIKNLNMKIDESGEHRKIQLQELEKIQNEAYENSRICKEKIDLS